MFIYVALNGDTKKTKSKQWKIIHERVENVENENWKDLSFEILAKIKMDSESAPMDTGASGSRSGSSAVEGGAKKKDSGSMFTLKKWHAVAMWSWDVECDTCAICRVQVMDACLRCQSETKGRVHLIIIWFLMD